MAKPAVGLGYQKTGNGWMLTARAASEEQVRRPRGLGVIVNTMRHALPYAVYVAFDALRGRYDR